MAKAIWDWSPTAMTPQGHLSKEEVESIFTYVDNYAPPVVAVVGSGDAGDPNANNSESSEYWWWILSFLLVFVLFAIFGVRRELSAAIAAKE